MVQITELGYLGLTISDADAWKVFATQIIGLEWLDEGEGDRIHLRMDNWHHRITLHIGEGDDLAYLGLRVAGGAELAEMAEQLSRYGASFQVATEQECAERHVLAMLKLEDPSGNPLEIFHGPRVDVHKPFYPGRRMHGKFATGSGGLGHIIVRSDDPAESERFYTHALGMRGTVEYHQQLPDGQILKPYFMHCNDRDHSIAFGLGPLEKRINHLMLEVTDVDDVGMTHEIANAREVPIAITLGKHANDRMISFYMLNPSGWMIEYGAGARPAVHQTEYYIKDVWGHDFVLPIDGI
ncbi:VOC family protein [Novosphingobium pentaromativorans]|uniref:Glyoxalase/bleomycin resistance protein/dioxygenase n=1 Tax=Novosphingobium pentaromativorans US6-1 TaxID=1088721 RepID=G6EKS3_9SPHN|nr:VOC family protein [Novosphingobium pentaromativorans]AIT80489.1 naphthalene 1,2-dioxygenase [Novosphingobium pentaromativorans US6-1]EHJ58097.1 glyoxalase/bleomycin resistance protein/dioxygenase [Novosphingobium pentaromativorans US6-1]